MSTQEKIAGFYRVLIDSKPEDDWINNEAARVEAGVVTLGQVLKNLLESRSFHESHSADIVRLSYFALGRAPDLKVHQTVMDALRGGMSFEDVVSAVLAIPGNPLSNDGLPENRHFAEALVFQATGKNDTALVEALASMLTEGVFTRASMLAEISGMQGLGGIPPDAEIAALTFLAAVGREITPSELNMPFQGIDAWVIQALTTAGISATAGKLAINREGDSVTLYSDLSVDFRWDMPADRFTQSGNSKFKVFFSLDKGLSGSVIDFQKTMVEGVTQVDASRVTGQGKVVFLGDPIEENIFMAPVGGSQATGGGARDFLAGNVGVDVFYATGGRDVLTGGLGDDRFVLPVSTVFQSGGADENTVSITDFGLGKDTLDFSRLLNRNVDISKITPVLASTKANLPASNGSVTLIDNDGLWVDGEGVSLRARKPTVTDIADLFSTAGEDSLYAKPVTAGKFVLITADTRNTADVWLILNSVVPKKITNGQDGPLEIFKVAELHGSWNPSLVGISPVLGTGLEI